MIALGIVVLYVVGLGAASLWEIDEAIYAEIAREMLVRHDYLAPFYNYAPRFDKPPLIYWLTAGAYRVFGLNELAVRGQSALFGLLTIALVGWLGRKMFSPPAAGRCSAVVLATSLGWFIVSRLGITDAALTFGLTLALAALWVGWQDRNGRWYLLAGVGLGLAILAKGPVAVVLFGGVIFGALGTRLLEVLRNGWAWLGFALGLVIPLPWHLAMNARYGSAFWSSYFGYHMFTRFTTGIEQHGFPWWYYLPVLLATFLPWSLFVPSALRTERRSEREQSGYRLLVAWAGLIFLFFSIAKTKLPGYILPVLPPLALLVGRYHAEGRREPRSDHNRAPYHFGAGLCVVGVLGLVLWYYARAQVPPEYLQAYRWLAFFPLSYGLAGTVLLIWVGTGRRRAGLTFWVLAATVALTLAGTALVVIPALEVNKPVKPLATRARSAPAGTVVASALGDAGAPFYARRYVQYTAPGAPLRALLHGARPAWIMAYRRELQAAGLTEQSRAGRAKVTARLGDALLVTYTP